jgi:hypothetical protein
MTRKIDMPRLPSRSVDPGHLATPPAGAIRDWLVGWSVARAANELPETLIEGAADTWAYPTSFGNLFGRRGSSARCGPTRTSSWRGVFHLAADTDVTITSRQAPTDELELTSS